MKLDKNKLSNMIKQEIRKLVDEDALHRLPGPGEPHYLKTLDHDEELDSCPSCGETHPGDNGGCPGSMGNVDAFVGELYESCGCGGSPEPAGLDDYSLDYVKDTGALDLDTILDALHARNDEADHISNGSFDTGAKQVDIDWEHPAYGRMHGNIEDMSAEEAFGAGHAMGTSGEFDNLDNSNITPDEAFMAGSIVGDKHDHAYMAKPQLRKIANYSQKLYDMLPEDYDMTDWQRSHLSSIADDISEVYHSLEHKLYKGEI